MQLEPARIEIEREISQVKEIIKDIPGKTYEVAMQEALRKVALKKKKKSKRDKTDYTHMPALVLAKAIDQNEIKKQKFVARVTKPGQFDSNIGNFFEQATHGQVVELGDGWKATFVNVSQGWHKKSDTGDIGEYYNKADTLIKIYKPGVKDPFVISVSDKTGGDLNATVKDAEQ